jgi:pyroglutamyl-peptidase
MKLLIYAFEPFGRNEQNISHWVLNRLNKRKGLGKIVLPVEFNDSIFIKMVQAYRPDAILGLGQYPRGKKVRIERLASNERKTKGKAPSKIMSEGPHNAKTTLRLKSDSSSWISYNAGRFVCNYSMYVLLTNPVSQSIPLAFLHIPKNSDITQAVRFVESKIDEIIG